MGFLSTHGLAISKNITQEDNFLMYNRKNIHNRTIEYSSYNRFPITTFIILKTTMDCFAHNLNEEIVVAKRVMLFFFMLSLLLTYIILIELTAKNYIVSIIVTLFVFSSHELLMWKDMIFNDIPSLFGFLLTFHGIVMYEKYRHFKQLIVKSLIALLLGWQVYSLLLIFILINTFILMYKHIKNNVPFPLFLKKTVRSNEFKLGLYTLLFGLMILSLNFFNEYKSSNTKTFIQMDSVQSALDRLEIQNQVQESSISTTTYDDLSLKNFVFHQITRIAKLIFPAIVNDKIKLYTNYSINNYQQSILLIILAFWTVYFILKYAYKDLIYKKLIIILFFSTFIWVLVFKTFVTFHDFQVIYYIGIAIVFYLSLVYGVTRLCKSCKISSLLLLILAIYTFSSSYVYMEQKYKVTQKNNYLQELQNLVDIVRQDKNENIVICTDEKDQSKLAGTSHAIDFAFAGYFLGIEQKKQCQYLLTASIQIKNENLIRVDNNKYIHLYHVLNNTQSIDRK
jgi:hypothetical protein